MARFLLAYLLLRAAPFPWSLLPDALVAPLLARCAAAWSKLVVAFAEHVVDLPVTAFPAGSGDTSFNYAELALQLALASVLWVATARVARRFDSSGLLAVVVRAFLACELLSYGMSKVLPIQFAAPSPDRLLGSLGDCSPMGLLWTLMGISRPYQIFSGAVEVVAGALLLVRPLAPLGALLATAAMANVVALDCCYGVPVKLHALHLLALALLLVGPRCRALIGWSRGAAVAAVAATRSKSIGLVEALLVAGVLVGQLQESSADLCELAEPLGASEAARAPEAPERGWDGCFEAVVAVTESGAAPPTVADGALWRRVTLASGVVTVRTMADDVVRYRAFADTEGALRLLPFGAALDAPRADVPAIRLRRASPLDAARAPAAAEGDGASGIELAVDLASPAATVLMRRLPPRDFPLTSGRFRWIVEQSPHR